MNAQTIPVYLRLREEIVTAIIEGAYPDGALLPSVRSLAADQGANPLTVAKAYQQLQNDGLIEVRRGVGMFVVPGAAEHLRRSESARFLAEDWPAIRRKLRVLGLSPGDLLAGS